MQVLDFEQECLARYIRLNPRDRLFYPDRYPASHTIILTIFFCEFYSERRPHEPSSRNTGIFTLLRTVSNQEIQRREATIRQAATKP
jgi:hypothetical protein